MKKINRKEKLVDILVKNETNARGIIIELIQSGCLDKTIVKIDDKKTYTKCNSLIKKGYLTGEEQFIDLLGALISYFKNNIPNIIYESLCIEFLLKKHNLDFLLEKKYYYDDENIPYFQSIFKKLLVTNMYENLQVVSHGLNKKELLKLGFNKDLTLYNEEDIDKLFKFMQIMALSNTGEYALIYLFDSYKCQLKELVDKKDKDIEEKAYSIATHYIFQYKVLLKNSIRKYKYIKKVFDFL